MSAMDDLGQAARERIIAAKAIREANPGMSLVEALRELDAAPVYLVWSHEHRAWWRPNGWGYCADVWEAGRYDEAGAIKACSSGQWLRDGRPHEVMVLAPEHGRTRFTVAEIREVLELIRRRVDEATQAAMATRVDADAAQILTAALVDTAADISDPWAGAPYNPPTEPDPHADCPSYAGQQVTCDRCGRTYQCTPEDDHYCTVEGDHCCEPCLTAEVSA